MNIYSIKNDRISFFNRPIYCESENEAISYIQNVLMSDADRALLSLKYDLSLYFLGSIDFTTGVFDVPKKPKQICSLDYIFDMIPADRVPQTSNQLRDRISALESAFSDLSKGGANVVD